jgi:hypothetical protein
VRLGTFQGLPAIMVAEEFGNRGGEYFLTGVAYTDNVTADRFYTVGEGMANITLTATNEQTGTVYSTATATAGGYALQVPNGTYRVTASGSGWNGPVEYSHVPVFNQNFKLDINSRTPAAGIVEGIVYRDLNQSSTLDGADQRAADIQVFLDVDRDGVRDAIEPGVTTAANGVYRFTGLAPGSYPLGVVSPASWEVAASVTVPAVATAVGGATRSGPNFPLIQGFPWQNKVTRFDVNGDNEISPTDALVILIDMNANGARQLVAPQQGVSAPPPYVDVTGDGYLSPLDPLTVIIELNRLNRLTPAAARSVSPPPAASLSSSPSLSSSLSSPAVQSVRPHASKGAVPQQLVRAAATDVAFALAAWDDERIDSAPGSTTWRRGRPNR